MHKIVLFLLLVCSAGITQAQISETVSIPEPSGLVYRSDKLEIHRLTDHVYQHISYLQTDDFGNVPCNGMVVTDGYQAVVFDTPTDDAASRQLIGYFKDILTPIRAVVATHFHNDCVGGLKEFHQQGIASYANQLTIDLLKKKNDGTPIPQHGFEKKLRLPVGQTEVFAEFLGEGHTKDNIVGYFPQEKALFGGCLVKELNADKGYLGDANVKAWPQTIRRLKEKYGDAQLVIPGHGSIGGSKLFDYTMELFK